MLVKSQYTSSAARKVTESLSTERPDVSREQRLHLRYLRVMSSPFSLRLYWGVGLLSCSQGCVGCRGRGRPDDSSWHYYRSKLTSATFHSTRVTVCGLCVCHLWYRRTLSRAWNVRLNTVHHDINYLALKPSKKGWKQTTYYKPVNSEMCPAGPMSGGYANTGMAKSKAIGRSDPLYLSCF